MCQSYAQQLARQMYSQTFYSLQLSALLLWWTSPSWRSQRKKEILGRGNSLSQGFISGRTSMQAGRWGSKALALHHSAPHTATQFVTSFSHRNNLRKEGAASGLFYRPVHNHSSWGWGGGQIKQLIWGSQVTLVVKNLPANAQDTRDEFDPWGGTIPWRRKWQPTQYSCLENLMDRGAWQATVSP